MGVTVRVDNDGRVLPLTDEDLNRLYSELLDELRSSPIKAAMLANLFWAVEEDRSLARELAELFEEAVHATPPQRRRKVPIPPALRWRVWARDDFRCQYCGRREQLSVDYVVPEARGGRLIIENLVTACTSCNSAKGTREAQAFADRTAVLRIFNEKLFNELLARGEAP